MLSQFRIRYPSGSLISELLEIHEGQFVVRVEVQIDGVTRATGLAAAENLEMAEDQARSRALMVLGIEAKSPLSAESKTTSSTTGIELEQTSFTSLSRWNGAKSLPTSLGTLGDVSTLTSPVPAAPEERSDRLPSTPVAPIQATGEALEENVDLAHDFSPASSEDSLLSLGNEARAEIYAEHGYQDFVSEPEQAEPTTATAAKEPVDMSDTLAKTSIELQRLGWTTQKGRNYLKKTYGKASRQQLTELEMFEFLAYLKSQPTPNSLPLELAPLGSQNS